MKAHELLDSEDKWTINFLARNESDLPAPVFDESAVKWCAIGAIEKCYDKVTSLPERCDLLYLIKKEIGGEFISVWNDSSSYEEVVAVLRKLDI